MYLSMASFATCYHWHQNLVAATAAYVQSILFDISYVKSTLPKVSRTYLIFDPFINFPLDCGNTNVAYTFPFLSSHQTVATQLYHSLSPCWHHISQWQQKCIIHFLLVMSSDCGGNKIISLFIHFSIFSSPQAAATRTYYSLPNRCHVIMSLMTSDCGNKNASHYFPPCCPPIRLRQQGDPEGQPGPEAGTEAQPSGAHRQEHPSPALRDRQKGLQGCHRSKAYQVSHCGHLSRRGGCGRMQFFIGGLRSAIGMLSDYIEGDIR